MSEAQTLVPRFGNWDMNVDTPYTVVFDKARAVKDGNIVNPSDPADYPTIYTMNHLEGNNSIPQSQKTNSNFHKLNSATTARPHHVRRSSVEERDSRRQSSDLHYQNTSSSGRRAPTEQTAHHSQAESRYSSRGDSTAGSWRSTNSDTSRRGSHLVGGREVNELLVKESPFHQPAADPSPALYQAYHGRQSRKTGATSPGRERRVSSDSGSYLAPATTARSQRRSGSSRGEMPDRGVVPKFGDWDANNPTSGEDFTVIFNKARDDKKSKTVRGSALQPASPSRVDEDLYKPSFSQKSSGGIWNLLCCSHADPL